jgi:hypothetical protein
MHDTTQIPPLTRRSPTLRFLRWLFSVRILGRMLCVAACLATLVIASFVFENLRWKRAWDNYRSEPGDAARRLDWDSVVPPRVPDDQNFAMTPLLAPLFDFVPGTQRPRDTNAVARLHAFPSNLRVDEGLPSAARGLTTDYDRLFEYNRTRPIPTAPGTRFEQLGQLDRKQAAAKVLEVLAPVDPALAELSHAIGRPSSRFNLRYEHEPPYEIVLPHLAIIRRCAQTLCWRAVAQLELGRPDAAFPDVDLALRLADTLKGEPILISHLVRLAITQHAMSVIWEGLRERRWSDPQLAQFQQMLARPQLLVEGHQAVLTERAWGLRTLQSALAHPWEYRDELGAGSWFIRVTPRGWGYAEQLNYCRAFDTFVIPAFAAEGRRLDPDRVRDRSAALEKYLERPFPRAIIEHRIAVGILVPALSNATRKIAQAQTLLDLAGLACALERHRLAHGQYPDSLDALVPALMKELPRDIANGQPLHYRRTDDGRFLLYSVGWNLKDDGGTPGWASVSKRSVDLEKGDWVWQ